MSNEKRPDSNQPEHFTMSFMGHLTELRHRLILAITNIAVIFFALVWFAQEIYEFVAIPVLEVLPQGAEMIATEITSTLFAPLKLTFFLSLILAMPLILHQAWSFISPGLYQNEKRIAIPLLLSSILLFYLGIGFAYIIVLPILMGFFSVIGPEGVAFMPDIQHYLNMVMKLFFAFGLAFEIPVALMLLIWSGVVSAQDIKAKRSYVVVGCFIVAMLLTPPDIFSQTLLAIPMWALFEVGLLMATWLGLESKQDQQ